MSSSGIHLVSSSPRLEVTLPPKPHMAVRILAALGCGSLGLVLLAIGLLWKGTMYLVALTLGLVLALANIILFLASMMAVLLGGFLFLIAGARGWEHDMLRESALCFGTALACGALREVHRLFLRRHQQTAR